MEKEKTKIIVENYNPKWKEAFNELKEIYNKILGNFVLAIEHVGSTSVEGLAAKPIIDIDIIIKDKKDTLEAVVPKLESLGYHHVGDLGIIGREVFKQKTSKVPFFNPQKDWIKHHLYVCRENSPSLQNHLNFRDFLRSNGQTRTDYGKLKFDLAQKFPGDIDSYIEGKTNFIIGVLKKNDFSETELEKIIEQNRKK
jgi:GrpB-like predicted nucleotidyltransferase (UPF0157 family)